MLKFSAMKPIYILFLAAAFAVAPAQAETRTLTNHAGSSVKAELIELADRNGAEYLTFKREFDRREFSIPLTTLMPEDQEAVRAWWRAEEKRRRTLNADVDLEISLKRNRKRQRLYDSAYVDEDLYIYTPEVEIMNDDLERAFKNNTG